MWLRLRFDTDGAEGDEHSLSTTFGEESGMEVRPADLNKAIAWLFIIGSALFALGSVPAYLNVVGAIADSVTYFVGSIFFTAASFAQLVQAQTPTTTEVDADSQYARATVRFWAPQPRDRKWLAAITQFPGTLFFNISTLAALAHNATAHEQDRRSGGLTSTDRHCSWSRACSPFSL
jgi:hypothetical protein